MRQRANINMSLPRYGDLSFFQCRGRPPSWICCVRVWTTHEEHLVVFMVVQDLAEIGAEVSIIRTILDFTHLV